MRFAWYGRKSTYNDKSDSVDNQRKMCKDYVYAAFKDVESWSEYSDEDFTGANINRPGLQRLLADIRLKMYDALIVYQLDRLSRSVRDFSNIYAELESYGVQFVSLNEHIDTTTAIGRAMMMVTAVFAQMERETIATRVKDNMRELAKKGYWRSGHAPVGYTTVRKEIDGRKHVVLQPNPEGVEYLNWLADSFISSGKSLVALANSFRAQGIRTRNGCFFGKAAIHHILTSPYGVADTPEVWDYFSSMGCDMLQPRDAWDGTHGIIVNGRVTKKGKTSVVNPPDKWLVCIGYHEPVMSAEKWLAIQSRLKSNVFDKSTRNERPLLKGIIRCRCGSIMGVQYRRRQGWSYATYYCRRRTEEGREACDCPQARSDRVDVEVEKILKSIAVDPSLIYAYVKKDKPASLKDIKSFDVEIAKAEKRIQKLTEAISAAPGSSAVKYIMKEIESLDLSIQAFQREKAMALSEKRKAEREELSIEEKIKRIQEVMQSFDSMSMDDKNTLAKDLIKSCVWDGEKLELWL